MVAQLIDEVQRCEPDDEKLDDLAQQMSLALTVHAAIEESLFYPVLRDRAEDTEEQVDVFEAFTEHDVVKHLIAAHQRPAPQARDLQGRAASAGRKREAPRARGRVDHLLARARTVGRGRGCERSASKPKPRNRVCWAGAAPRAAARNKHARPHTATVKERSRQRKRARGANPNADLAMKQNRQDSKCNDRGTRAISRVSFEARANADCAILFRLQN